MGKGAKGKTGKGPELSRTLETAPDRRTELSKRLGFGNNALWSRGWSEASQAGTDRMEEWAEYYEAHDGLPSTAPEEGTHGNILLTGEDGELVEVTMRVDTDNFVDETGPGKWGALSPEEHEEWRALGVEDFRKIPTLWSTEDGTLDDKRWAPEEWRGFLDAFGEGGDEELLSLFRSEKLSPSFLMTLAQSPWGKEAIGRAAEMSKFLERQRWLDIRPGSLFSMEQFLGEEGLEEMYRWGWKSSEDIADFAFSNINSPQNAKKLRVFAFFFDPALYDAIKDYRDWGREDFWEFCDWVMDALPPQFESAIPIKKARRATKIFVQELLPDKMEFETRVLAKGVRAKGFYEEGNRFVFFRNFVLPALDSVPEKKLDGYLRQFGKEILEGDYLFSILSNDAEPSLLPELHNAGLTVKHLKVWAESFPKKELFPLAKWKSLEEEGRTRLKDFQSFVERLKLMGEF